MSNLFPTVDPIPLPAPVWLFKVLHHLTLALHFSFLGMLIGGLFLAMVWNFLGHLSENKSAISASGVVVNRLPIVMTYVINLGVPPLLFVQVLYGRAIYTSTVLIGAYWISVILAVMLAYFTLYRMAYLAEQKKVWWPWGLVAMTLIGYVGRVYSTASTLMLKPEVWPAMYAATPNGTNLPPDDPTLWPRWAMVMVGSLAFGALGTTLYTCKSSLAEDVKAYIRRGAGYMAIAALALLAWVGPTAYRVQPDFVRQALQGSAFTEIIMTLWTVLVALSLTAALGLILAPKAWSWLHVLWVSLPAFLAVTAFEILRDSVRDICLAKDGFDVWQSPVNTNWLVVGLFLGLFVIGAGFLIWVLMIMRQAKSTEENYA